MRHWIIEYICSRGRMAPESKKYFANYLNLCFEQRRVCAISQHLHTRRQTATANTIPRVKLTSTHLRSHTQQYSRTYTAAKATQHASGSSYAHCHVIVTLHARDRNSEFYPTTKFHGSYRDKSPTALLDDCKDGNVPRTPRRDQDIHYSHCEASNKIAQLALCHATRVLLFWLKWWSLANRRICCDLHYVRLAAYSPSMTPETRTQDLFSIMWLQLAPPVSCHKLRKFFRSRHS